VKGATRWRNRCRIGGGGCRIPRGSKSFVPPGAIVSLRSCRPAKKGRVKVGEAQETLGDGAGPRPWSERREQGFLVAGRRMVSSVRAGTFAMAIGPSGRCARPRLAGPAGGVLPGREQKFASVSIALARKSPQETCQSMNERRLDHCSRKFLTTVRSANPSRQARRRDGRRLLCGSIPGTSETSSSTDSLGHIVDPRSIQPLLAPASPEHPVSGFLPVSRPWRLCLVRWGGPRMRQHHAAEIRPVVGTAAGSVRASLYRACGQPWIGSMPACRHHARSLRERCTAR
jgi:hypothetical protein